MAWILARGMFSVYYNRLVLKQCLIFTQGLLFLHFLTYLHPFLTRERENLCERFIVCNSEKKRENHDIQHGLLILIYLYIYISMNSSLFNVLYTSTLGVLGAPCSWHQGSPWLPGWKPGLDNAETLLSGKIGMSLVKYSSTDAFI